MTLEARRISKAYGSVRALEDVSVAFEPGEIHAVLGENGAGKSTLMNVLSGFARPDSGEALLGGKQIPLGQAHECRRMGIEMIHQHFTLVPEFTVAENLALAQLKSLASRTDINELARSAIEAGQRLGWHLDPSAKVRELSVGMEQRLEILKSLATEAPVIIFDEPTAVLAPDEVEELFRVLRRLRDEGRIVILIAHKLREIMSVADRATVLRLGKWVGSAPVKELDERILTQWMVGDLPTVSRREQPGVPQPFQSFEALTIRGDRGEIAVRNVSFELRRREVLGFGGVDGNGQVELAEYLAGARKSQATTHIRPKNVGYIPQDRQVDGLALNMTVQENMTVVGQRLPELVTGPFLRMRQIKAWATELIRKFDIRVRGPEARVGALSGGNQQKVVVSRAIAERPELVVAVNPTRGLDLKATQFVREQLRRASDEGAAVALFTTDLDELFELADRRLFMTGGELREADKAEAMFGSTTP